MQATRHTVRFDDRVRLEAENNICREGGPLPDCFATPRALIFGRMEQVYYYYYYSFNVISALMPEWSRSDGAQPKDVCRRMCKNLE